MMEYIYDMIIIGGGPAGYTAALYASRAGLDTLVVERMSAGGQMALTGDIDNYPGFDEGVDGFTLGMKMQQGAERFGAKTKYAEVTGVDLSDKIKRVKTSSEELLAKTVVIATGANPRELDISDEQQLIGRGVHYCAHCDGRFYKDKTVVVVGGGNSAAIDALLLSKLAKKVYLIHRRDALRAERVYHDRLKQTENVEFKWNREVDALLADVRLSGVRLLCRENGEKEELALDGLFISIGRRPETRLFEGQLAQDEYGYIVAGEDTETNIPGVFAAGDVRTKPFRQIVTAASDGAVAAYFAEKYIHSL